MSLDSGINVKISTNPSGIDSLHQSPGSLGGLHRDLQHAVHVDMVRLKLMSVLRRSPSYQHALVELPFECEVLRRRN